MNSYSRSTVQLRAVALTIIALLFVPAALTAQQQSNAPPPLTTQELEHYRYLLQNTKKGFIYELNLAEDHQYQYVVSFLRRAGVTSQTSPQLYRNIETARRAKKPGPPALADSQIEPIITPPLAQQGYIESINAVQYVTSLNNNASTGMLSSILGGTDSTTIAVNFTTPNNPDNPFGYTSFSQSAGGNSFNPTQTAAIPASQQNQPVTATAMFTISKGPNTSFFTHSEDTDFAYATSVCVTAPNYQKQQAPASPCPPYATSGSACINSGSTTTAIISCYGRSSIDCNYQWAGSGYPTVFPLTISGSVVFPSNIVNPLQGSATMYLQSPTGTCRLVPIINGQKNSTIPFNSTNFSISSNPKQLNFCFQATQFQNSAGTTSCLSQVSQIANLFLVLNPLVSGGKFGYAQISSCPPPPPIPPPTPPPPPPPAACANKGNAWFAAIPQIEILQGCIAAGTKILMADGSLKLIETFKGDGTEVVIVNSRGDKKTVVGTISGPEEKPMFEVNDNYGNKVLLTEMHPVVTSEGIKLAFRLKVGDTLTTRNGTSKITRINRVPFPGRTYGLSLDTRESAQKGQNNFFANGILVGDSREQFYFSSEVLTKGYTREETLQRLPRMWHQDYLNSLKK